MTASRMKACRIGTRHQTSPSFPRHLPKHVGVTPQSADQGAHAPGAQPVDFPTDTASARSAGVSR
jgi:hypothetical protein